MIRSLATIIIFMTVIAFLAGCTTTATLPASGATPGLAKKKIEKGVTTQEEIINLFGAPNLVTKTKDGGELWVYSNYATVKKARSIFGGLGVFGAGDTVGGSGIAGGGSSSTISLSRSTNLMIKFDKNEVVIDYYFSQLQY